MIRQGVTLIAGITTPKTRHGYVGRAMSKKFNEVFIALLTGLFYCKEAGGTGDRLKVFVFPCLGSPKSV
jgi:hypothetical protein